jgi:DNA-binding SARP family transcriptional activator
MTYLGNDTGARTGGSAITSGRIAVATPRRPAVASAAMSPASDNFAVQLFGALTIAHGEQRVGPRDFSGVKPRQVLEILLAARGRRVPTDRLGELLWPKDLPRNVTASLATYVSVLRRTLEAVGTCGRDLIVTETETYRFAVDKADLDLDRFDRLVTQAGDAPTAERRRLLEQALALAQGDVLEDEPYAEWAEDIRTTYRARVLAAHLDAADAALAERDHDAALRHGEAAIAIDGFGERAHRLAMLALYALGRQHEALDVYLRLRGHLAGGLGLEPMPETKALHASVLRQEDVDELLPRSVSTLTRLAPPIEAPLRLLGRVEELDAITRLVRGSLEGSSSLTLVESEAGLGRTRLLAELAAGFPAVRIGRASASPLERHLPYVLLAEAVRSALPGIDDPRTLPALRRILPERSLEGTGDAYPEVDALEALVELIRAHAPVLLLVDDLQWADPATLAAIAYLQRRCATVPLAIVGTARTEDVGPGHALRRLCPDLLVCLAPLTPAELASIEIPDLHERTGGNATFVAAAIREGTTRDLGASLSGALLAHAEAEGPRAHDLLLCASVLGDRFDPEILAEVADVEAGSLSAELDHLCARGLLVADGLHYRFRYPIQREALLATVSPARRRVLHACSQAAERDRAWPEQTDQAAPVGFDHGRTSRIMAGTLP